MTHTRRALALIGVVTALLSSASALAQRATIEGRIVVKGSEVALGYTIVASTPGARERFSDADGRFSIRDVPQGRVTVSAKHVGYTPFDTTINVTSGDTIRLKLELSLVTIQLPAIHSLAKACVHPGASTAKVGLELATLFEQLKLNAERHSLLSQTYPFELTVERKVSKPEPALEARFVAIDTVLRSSERDWHYAPGKMLGTREFENGPFAGKWVTVTMPELVDFADDRFLENHCFDFGGLEAMDGDTLIRIDFSPAPSVRSPDVGGAVYLDRETYQLRMTMITLVNLTRRLRGQVAGQSIRADFKEVLPGVPMLNVVSSFVIPKDDPKLSSQEPATEVQRTLAVRFLRGKP